MKKLLLTLSVILAVSKLSAQVFWIENFGVGCNQGQLANNLNPTGNGVWTVTNTGVNNPDANQWYISATEAGMGVGNCNDGCLLTGGNNRTLHVGYDIPSGPFIDQGSYYAANSTNKRVESPTINCSGRTNIYLRFNYFVNGGIFGADYAEVLYSDNNGLSWSPTSTLTAPTGTCGYYTWTSYSIALPASSYNNPNVKVAFRWQNVAGGASNPAVTLDDVSLWEIFPSPPFNVSFALSNTICVGNSATVTANTGTSTATSIGYTWTSSPAGPTIASPSNSTTAITFPSAGTYTILLTAFDGSTTATDSTTITAGPNVTSTGPTWPICPPPTAQGIIYLKGYGASTYTWQPGGYVGDSLTLYPYPSVSTTYTVTGTDVNGCTSFTTQYVQVLPMPWVWASGPSLVCGNANNCFSAGGSLWVYSWSGPCGFSDNGTAPCFSLALGCGGTYTVGGTDGTCVGITTIGITVSSCTGMNEVALNNNSFELSPNPFTDRFNVKTNPDIKESTELEINDISGRIISKSKCNFNSEGIYSIDVSEFSPGIYFARIISENQISQPIKIIKE